MKHGRGHHKECKLMHKQNEKETPEVVVVGGLAVRQVKMRVLTNEVEVDSPCTDTTIDRLYLEVPKIIEIKIYPSRGRR